MFHQLNSDCSAELLQRAGTPNSQTTKRRKNVERSVGSCFDIMQMTRCVFCVYLGKTSQLYRKHTNLQETLGFCWNLNLWYFNKQQQPATRPHGNRTLMDETLPHRTQSVSGSFGSTSLRRSVNGLAVRGSVNLSWCRCSDQNPETLTEKTSANDGKETRGTMLLPGRMTQTHYVGQVIAAVISILGNKILVSVPLVSKVAQRHLPSPTGQTH